MTTAPAPSAHLEPLFRALKLATLKARRWLRKHEPLIIALLDNWGRFRALDHSGWTRASVSP